MADKQHKVFVELKPSRGTIYDRMERIMAMYLDVPSIFGVPKEIEKKDETARLLSETTGVDKEDLRRKLAKDNYFTWVKRRVQSDEAEAVKRLNLKGIYVNTEAKRFYPGGRLACHVLGITDVDSEGLEGLELYYNEELKGEYGWRRSLRDAKRREITTVEDGILPARDGIGLVLTIDEIIQHIVEKEVEAIVRQFKPEAVSIIVMEPSSGRILGLVNYPWFNLNKMDISGKGDMRNRAISDSFEPGSVFKIITASAVLEEGVVDFGTEFFCENGEYKIGKRVLHDHRPYGNLTFREVIEKSSNIGTSKAAQLLGMEGLYGYVKKYNFGEKTGVDLPGEARGIVRDFKIWQAVDMTTIPMGQGIAVTGLQMASALSAIVNGGLLMRPRIVMKKLNAEGMVTEVIEPEVIRRVISPETSMKMKELLVGVVENGTGKPARLVNYIAGGKTGTAQKVRPNGGYYDHKYVSSFMGFATYRDPKIVLIVCVDDPKGKHYGSQVAAPSFKKIMEQILSYLEVKPDREEWSSHEY